MADNSIAWLQDIDWRTILTTIHIAGMMLALTAASIGHVIGARVLLQAGPRPQKSFLRLIHAGIVVGLCLLWLSGGGIAVTTILAGTLPPDIIFKLGTAVLVSIAVLLVHEFVLPMMYARRRPLAVHLAWGELITVCVISAASVACWLALIAYGFSAELQLLPVGRLFVLLFVFAAASAFVCLLMAVVVRLTMRKAPPENTSRDTTGSRARPAEVAAPTPRPIAVSHPVPVSPTVPQARPAQVGAPPEPASPALVQRLRETMATRQSTVNPERHARAHPQQGRPPAQPTPDQTDRRVVQTRGEIDDDRLLHKWLQGSRTKQAQPDVPAPVPAEAPRDDAPTLKDVTRACRRALFGAGAVSFVSNMLMLTGPLFMLQIYDRVLTSKSLPTLTALFVLTLALFAFMGALDLIRSRLLVRIGLRVDRLMAPQVFERAIEVGNAEQQSQRLQLHKDLQHIRQFVSGAGSTAIFDMPWAPVYFGIVLMFHWALGAVALIGAAALVALSLLNELMSRKSVSAAAELSADAEQVFEAGRRNSEVLQAMGMSPRYRSRWLDKHSAELLVVTKAADIAGLLSVLTKTSRLVLQSAMLAMGAYLVLGSEISPGVMIAASIIMSRALAPIELAIAHWRGFIAMRQGMGRLSKEFAEPSTPARRLSLPSPEGHLEIENVFAGPIGGRDPVLKGLAFKLQPGDALGVLGPSGSGKSTLARVLVGVWPALRGRVSLDGAPLEHWPVEQLGRHIGYLPQEAVLFNGTVAENIARFQEAADPAAIIAAAESANVHKMILGLSEGYSTRVGEGGKVLSGGQRQRIALARALYGDPALVVLDEPNANLDSDGESALADAIAMLRRAGRTVVVMAHRRKALEHVNLLLVLKDGRQAAFGPKEQILRAASAASSRQSERKLHAAE